MPLDPKMRRRRLPSEEAFRAKPDPIWAQASRAGWNQDDLIDLAEIAGWTAIRAWGSCGWPVGEWPRALLFWRVRDRQQRFELTEYVQGDAATYRFPAHQLLVSATDRRALAWWLGRGEPWAWSYRVDARVPLHLRGPYAGSADDLAHR